MLGYRGIGGEIDGVRNPTLWARTGETVRITIVNGELMVHDVALEKPGVKSTRDSRQGRDREHHLQGRRQRHLLLLLPGHRVAGMEGRLDVSDAARVQSEGDDARGNGRPLNLDFEKGTLEDWTATGDAFELVKGDGLPGRRRTEQRVRASRAPTGSAAA